MTHSILIKIKSVDGEIVAVDQMPLPSSVNTTDLVIETRVVDAPARPRRKDHSPLSPDALTLADLRVGMRIRVNHKDNPGWSYSAIVGGKPTTNEYDITVVPLVRLGDEFDYVMGYPEDMGLMRYVDGSRTWNRYWYTVAAE